MVTLSGLRSKVLGTLKTPCSQNKRWGMFDLTDAERTRLLMNATPGWAAIAKASDLDDDTVDAVLGEAAKLAAEQLNPVGLASDAEGCTLVDPSLSASCVLPIPAWQVSPFRVFMPVPTFTELLPCGAGGD